MQRTATTTTTIEEISSNATINGATISESIGITTIETTPTPAERQHHHHHHHKHHHEHHQREESETTLVITDVSDGQVIIETDTEQPQEQHHHHQHRHHHQRHRQKQQKAPQPPVPPPLPTTAPPYLTPTESLTQEEFVWQTDLDLPPQQSAPTSPEVEAPTPPAPPSIQSIQAAATVAATTTVATVAATTTQPPDVCQTELIIETTGTAAPSSPTELVFVGVVSAETTDKRSKSYRVSTDLEAPPQEPKKCCRCIIA
ncbi:protein hunchback [Drosophila innubila]|uniref:protein hunchback n=1 Tax=Drosophila innubila TaxID=198719 RepID=UPI00148CE767|nr:protein hunchback [Drosophila innubila]XP_034476581.1 protein hunchback [Drosophila innubila]